MTLATVLVPSPTVGDGEEPHAICPHSRTLLFSLQSARRSVYDSTVIGLSDCALMATTSQVDEKQAPAGGGSAAREDVQTVAEATLAQVKEQTHPMTRFVESCLETVADSAVAAERKSRGRPRAPRLLRVLSTKRNILVTTHLHPDPDALASSMAMVQLLRAKLPAGTRVSMSIKGQVTSGINATFAKLSDLELVPWDDEKLKEYDGFVLLDTQPQSSFSPLPKTIEPDVVIDHHQGKKSGKPHCPFCDIRTEVGATSSMVFSYLMELEVAISPALGASLLFAIESDLAGASGTPGELDNIALSSLTLIADTHRLYQMRYVDLPQSYYIAYASALSNAVHYDNALMSHIDQIDSLEKPAVMADFLLRFDEVQWVLVTAVHENKMILSLRTSSKAMSAADMIRKLLRNWGEGGGHRKKAGGFIPLTNGTPTEVARLRDVLRRRYLSALKIRATRGQRLVPKATTT
jgi:nanoRNase/pAp phosphatase (c-di-AMP/oligoRNAs hydrolase)